MKKEKEFELHKKINGPKWFLRPIEMVGAWLFAGPFGTKTKIKVIKDIALTINVSFLNLL